MRVLPESFTKLGWNHQLEWRDGKVAIYRRSKEDHHPHWEVIVIREQQEKEVNGIRYEHAEIYPSSEQFGTFGFTHQSLEVAKAKAETLVEAIKP